MPKKSQKARAFLYKSLEDASWWTYAVDANGDRIGVSVGGYLNKRAAKQALLRRMLHWAYHEDKRTTWTLHARAWVQHAFCDGVIWNPTT